MNAFTVHTMDRDTKRSKLTSNIVVQWKLMNKIIKTFEKHNEIWAQMIFPLSRFTEMTWKHEVEEVMNKKNLFKINGVFLTSCCCWWWWWCCSIFCHTVRKLIQDKHALTLWGECRRTNAVEIHRVIVFSLYTNVTQPQCTLHRHTKHLQLDWRVWLVFCIAVFGVDFWKT